MFVNNVQIFAKCLWFQGPKNLYFELPCRQKYVVDSKYFSPVVYINTELNSSGYLLVISVCVCYTCLCIYLCTVDTWISSMCLSGFNAVQDLYVFALTKWVNICLVLCSRYSQNLCCGLFVLVTGLHRTFVPLPYIWYRYWSLPVYLSWYHIGNALKWLHCTLVICMNICNWYSANFPCGLKHIIKINDLW